MNYFAHAIRFLDRPYFLAGLAVPDWLSVVDRRVRVRTRDIERHSESLAGADLEVAAGIRQHLADDQWFHGTAAFYDVTGQLGRLFREQFVADPEERWPYGFLGHLLCEMLIDSALDQRFPDRLDNYYNACGQIDGGLVGDLVERLTGKPVPNLRKFVELYRQERFLYDYADNQKLLRRVNQVMRRVELPVLPFETVTTLEKCRQVVARNLDLLLPDPEFTWKDC